jgi:hypothetical protein
MSAMKVGDHMGNLDVDSDRFSRWSPLLLPRSLVTSSVLLFTKASGYFDGFCHFYANK